MTSLFSRTARFELFALVAAAALLAVVSGALVPYADTVFRHGSRLYGFWNVEKRSAFLEEKKAKVRQENRLLDSLIAMHEKSVHTDENSIAATLYKTADSAGIRAARIEIGEKQSKKGRVQTPVTLQGSGAWSALGILSETIENLPAPSSIRFISAEKQGKERIALFMDFLLLSEEN